ncbi:hypothetical protein E2C01_026256 [Portunus trituberculatus]|uniref:Uncharacterized protein n=1 Tax=Portunus trituberculatus TaxID=210409 RepID=A0A5B7EFJ3_PORTR|nr:hypothetical protein [Portunus trituberculatus]
MLVIFSWRLSLYFRLDVVVLLFYGVSLRRSKRRKLSSIEKSRRYNLSFKCESQIYRLNPARKSQRLKEGRAPQSPYLGQEEWEVLSTGSRRRKVLRVPHLVETRNPFNVLKGVEKEEEVAGGYKERKEGDEAAFLPQDRVLIVDDSQA